MTTVSRKSTWTCKFFGSERAFVELIRHIRPLKNWQDNWEREPNDFLRFRAIDGAVATYYETKNTVSVQGPSRPAEAMYDDIIAFLTNSEK